MMQRWDYLVLNILKSYGINYRVNNEKVGEWKDFLLHDVLNRLGKQGYELVTFDGENYLFKRPAASLKPLEQPKADDSAEKDDE